MDSDFSFSSQNNIVHGNDGTKKNEEKTHRLQIYKEKRLRIIHLILIFFPSVVSTKSTTILWAIALRLVRNLHYIFVDHLFALEIL